MDNRYELYREYLRSVLLTWNRQHELRLQVVNAYLGLRGEQNEFYDNVLYGLSSDNSESSRISQVDEFGDVLYYYVVITNILSELYGEDTLINFNYYTNVVFERLAHNGLREELSEEAIAKLHNLPEINEFEVFKKIAFHGKPLKDFELMIGYFLDMLVYELVSGLVDNNLDLVEVINYNVAKLSARYPNGFPTQNVTGSCNKVDTKCCTGA